MRTCKKCKKILIGFDDPFMGCEHIESEIRPTEEERIIIENTKVLTEVKELLRGMK